MFLAAKLWIPNPDDEDEVDLRNVHITSELVDTDCIQLQISTGDQNLLLDVGDHQALMMAIDLIAKYCVSRDMKAEDMQAAMDSLNRAMNGDENEEE